MADIPKNKNYNKSHFYVAFILFTLFFAAIRHFFISETPEKTSGLSDGEVFTGSDSPDTYFDENEYLPDSTTASTNEAQEATGLRFTPAFNDSLGRPRPIRGVWSFDECFPDKNDVQIVAAQKNGVGHIRNREEAMALVKERKLVDISNSPYYVIDDLTHSMPYLVPKAQQLLNTISINFIDSLQMKGYKPHLLMITSVLRTSDDVKHLQKGNVNATTNSCHCYGTTVDITYTRFFPISGHYSPSTPRTRHNYEMKQILSEVLDDLRQQGACYVKYEKKQGCYHLTVK